MIVDINFIVSKLADVTAIATALYVYYKVRRLVESVKPANVEIKQYSENSVIETPVELNYSKGDLLVFAHPGKLDDPAFERLKESLDQCVKGNEDGSSKLGLILENGMKLQAVIVKNK